MLCLVVVGVVAMSTMTAPPAKADEPVDQFLSALRARGMHDTVVLYLQRLQVAGRLPEALQGRIEYELGLAHLESAKGISDPRRQSQDLIAAQEAFRRFTESAGDHPQALDARMQLGVVTLWQGRNLLRLAERDNPAAAETRREEARRLFTESDGVFAAAYQEAEELIASLPEFFSSDQREIKAQRDGALDALVRSRLFAADAQMAIGESYAEGSTEAEEAIKAAGRKYDEIAKDDKYPPNSPAGFLARRGAADCLEALENYDQALSAYASLLEIADAGEFVRQQQAALLTKTLGLMCDESLANYDDAATMGQSWLAAARGTEDETPMGLEIHHWVAFALHKKIEAIQADETHAQSAEGAREIRTLGEELLTHLELVASRRGAHQRDARDLLTLYRGAEELRPTNFYEARDAGISAVFDFDELLQSPDADLNADEQAAREAEKQQALTDGIEYLRMALSMGTDGVLVEEVNETRYYLCYALFHRGDFHEAAVVGEFMAKHQAATEYAQPAARIGLESYRQIYFSDRQGDREFQTRRLESMARIMSGKWPASPDADNAWMLLADLAFTGGDFPKAAGYLNEISEDSPRKGLAILKTGQADWGQFAVKSREEDASQAELDALLASSEQKLTEGIERAREAMQAGESPPYDLLAAEVSLAQLYSRTQRHGDAATLLQRERGVLETLENWPGGGSPRFPSIAYKAAMKAFVADGNLDATLQIMQRLNAEAATDPAAQQELTSIYLSMGNDLAAQLNELRQSRDGRQQLQKMGDGFQGVLDQISSHPEGASFDQLYWVASMYSTLGETFAGLDADKSKTCYQQAGTLYEQLLADPATDPQYSNYLRVLVAKSCRLEGTQASLQKGINLLLAVLDKNENSVDAQQEACFIFERWGDMNEQTAYFDLAINGYRDGASNKRLVWGWATLSAKVQRDERFRETYHIARFNMAECRYKKAMFETDGARKKETLGQARGDIAVTYRLGDQSLGGDEWKPRYEALLKQIQRELGESPPRGLSALDGGR